VHSLGYAEAMRMQLAVMATLLLMFAHGWALLGKRSK
jgi:hypothetical protein